MTDNPLREVIISKETMNRQFVAEIKRLGLIQGHKRNMVFDEMCRKFGITQ